MRLQTVMSTTLLAVASSAGLAQPCRAARTTGWIQNAVPADIEPLPGFGSFLLTHFRDWVAVGDVDADGADDVVIGLPECARLDCFDTGGSGAFGERRSVVQVYSGRTGDLIRELVSPSPAMIGGQVNINYFGNNLTVSDVNGDGHADIAVAAFGERIDLDQDGSPELNVGIVHVFCGASGALLYSLPGSAADDRMGWSMAFGGDWSGDGSSDLLVGRRNMNNLALDLFNGSDGAPIHSANIGGSGFLRIGNVGDVSGDGKDDVGVYQGSGANNAPRLFIYTSIALSPFADYEWSTYILVDPTNVGDVDGDGLADLVYHGSDFNGEPQLAPTVSVISVADGAVIQEFETPDDGVPSDKRLVSVGDVNGDGGPDVAVGPFVVLDDDGSFEEMHVYSLVDGECLGVWRTRDRSYDDDGHSTGEIAFTYTSMKSGDFDGDGLLDVVAVGIPQQTNLHPDAAFLRQINIFRRPGCPEDMTGDGFIGFADLSALLDTFNVVDSPGELPADIDGNGQVDFGDLNLILAAFNSGC